MTRINSGIPVSNLTDEHLRAEHREIKRICSLVRSRLDSGRGFGDIPSNFRLGSGHVLFFLDKGKYLLNRQSLLYDECLSRGFDITDYRPNYSVFTDDLFKDWIPSDLDNEIIRSRITEVIETSSCNWHYNRELITKDFAIKLLNK